MRSVYAGKRPVPIIPYRGLRILGARLRWIGRYSKRQKMFRALRLCWDRGTLGKGGYSVKFTLAFRPKLFGWSREYRDWDLTIAGIRLHYSRNYAGPSH